MQDPVCAVFSATDGVLYKRFLDTGDANELHSALSERKTGWKDGAVSIARGIRPFLDLDISELPRDTVRQIVVALRGYLVDAEISNWVRFYSHKFGEVRPHRDGSKDSAQYTLLIYLKDDFEGGRLSIKVPRTDEELLANDPHLKHKRFVPTPQVGWGILFSKDHLHWADEVIDGSKDFLLLEVKTEF